MQIYTPNFSIGPRGAEKSDAACSRELSSPVGVPFVVHIAWSSTKYCSATRLATKLAKIIGRCESEHGLFTMASRIHSQPSSADSAVETIVNKG
jgi:hypothetical protein